MTGMVRIGIGGTLIQEYAQLMKIIKTLAQDQINTASTSLVQIKEQTQYLANRQIK